MMVMMTGGCQCGRVRYTAEIEAPDAYLCHCRMCQRATGNVSIAFVNLPKTALAWEGEPGWYASSPIARRPFCPACGTPLGFEYHDSDKCDLHVATFDEADYFVPKFHFGVEAMHEAWLDTGDLPRYRITDNPATVERWMKAIGKLPD
jgi:hypothetical protein